MSLRGRLNLIFFLAVLPFFAVACRLIYLQLLVGSSLEIMASKELERQYFSTPPRGRILDRSGAPLTESIPSWTCFLDKSQLEEPAKAAAALSKILGISPETIRAKLRGRSSYIALKRDLDLDAAKAVAALKVQGIGLEQEQRRTYPNGTLIQSLLGKVGSEGQGLSGLEQVFEKELVSPPVKLEILRDGAGGRIYRRGTTTPEPPKKLVLTIERNAQFFAEQALEEAVRKSEAKRGMILAQDPSNGEILVMAVYPPSALSNPAVQDSFEPGSTLKAMTALAVLESGKVPAEERFDCEKGKWAMAPGVTLRDHEPEGMLNFREIMERSSNIGVAKAAERVGAGAIYSTLRAFGFGVRAGISYPGEAVGILPPVTKLDRVHLAQAAMGQGVAVTALQLTTAYSAIANGGTLLGPRVVRGLQLDDGEWVSRRELETVRRVGNKSAIRELVAILEGAVEVGTGKAAQVPGYRVAGKTGTAQKIDPKTGRYSRSLYVSSFVGFLPVSDPKVVVLAVIDEPKKGYYGSELAAPLFARVARDLAVRLNMSPDKPVTAAVPAEAVRRSSPARAAASR